MVLEIRPRKNKTVVDKHGDNFSYWIPSKVKHSHGVSCWKTIANTAQLVNTHSYLTIHSGRATSFWHDIWKGDASLASLFHSLYKLTNNKNVKVADMVTVDGNWSFNFKRNLTNSETDRFADLLSVIGSTPPVLDNLPDTRRWSLHNDGIFTVKTLYAKLIENSGIDNFPHQFIWKKYIPPKINFLRWCLLHDKLNTIDMLQLKGVDIYNSCALRGDDMESQEHIFLHFKVAHIVWSMVMPTDCWSWVIPRNFNSLAQEWYHGHFSAIGNFIRELIPAAVVQTLWAERNNRIFQQKHTFKTDDDLGLEVRSLALSWTTAAGRRVHLNFANTIHNNWLSIFV
ncbi:uncharacterized protein LOC113295998 [Papaver somniferum]|uniref:uncharacterized protein LOC113295998 n=1 Tax=Papaver somniferum TaxID=3469 RepID=UPI000E6FF70A|nr:uncharacterized protein LOC113295998 [Papaver somniferum]